jgi:hypothetical protein
MPIILLLFIRFLAGLPGAWLIMLALGNFSLARYGFVDCIPAGVILGMLVSKD